MEVIRASYAIRVLPPLCDGHVLENISNIFAVLSKDCLSDGKGPLVQTHRFREVGAFSECDGILKVVFGGLNGLQTANKRDK